MVANEILVVFVFPSHKTSFRSNVAAKMDFSNGDAHIKAQSEKVSFLQSSSARRHLSLPHSSRFTSIAILWHSFTHTQHVLGKRCHWLMRQKSRTPETMLVIVRPGDHGARSRGTLHAQKWGTQTRTRESWVVRIVTFYGPGVWTRCTHIMMRLGEALAGVAGPHWSVWPCCLSGISQLYRPLFSINFTRQVPGLGFPHHTKQWNYWMISGNHYDMANRNAERMSASFSPVSQLHRSMMHPQLQLTTYNCLPFFVHDAKKESIFMKHVSLTTGTNLPYLCRFLCVHNRSLVHHCRKWSEASIPLNLRATCDYLGFWFCLLSRH